MTAQPGLFDPRLASVGACVFGPGDPDWPGPHHCAACAADVARGCAAFAEAVARGTYDSAGYTPAERTAQRRRAAMTAGNGCDRLNGAAACNQHANGPSPGTRLDVAVTQATAQFTTPDPSGSRSVRGVR